MSQCRHRNDADRPACESHQEVCLRPARTQHTKAARGDYAAVLAVSPLPAPCPVKAGVTLHEGGGLPEARSGVDAHKHMGAAGRRVSGRRQCFCEGEGFLGE